MVLLKKCSWLVQALGNSTINFHYFLVSLVDVSAIPYNGCTLRNKKRLKKKKKRTMPKGTHYLAGR